MHKRVCAVYTKRESPFLSPFKKNKKKGINPTWKYCLGFCFCLFSLCVSSPVSVSSSSKSALSLSREKRRRRQRQRQRAPPPLFFVCRRRCCSLCVVRFCSFVFSCVVAKLSLSLCRSLVSFSQKEEEERLRDKIRTRTDADQRERENCSQREREREMMRAKLVLDVRGCSSSFSSSSRCGDDDDDDNKRKKKKTMRYARVTKRTPPKRDLGLVRVDDEQLTCGAKLDLDDDTFVISRVTKTYTLVRGKYVEDEKRRVEVESLERSLLNRQLSDVFKRS